MSDRDDNTRAEITTWYNKISEETRTALILVGVHFTPWDSWTKGCYFAHTNKNWTPEPSDDPEKFARAILDEIAGGCWYCHALRVPGANCNCGAPSDIPENFP
jgi:hypothetical protein